MVWEIARTRNFSPHTGPFFKVVYYTNTLLNFFQKFHHHHGEIPFFSSIIFSIFYSPSSPSLKIFARVPPIWMIVIKKKSDKKSKKNRKERKEVT
jgi:hypothetical protein